MSVFRLIFPFFCERGINFANLFVGFFGTWSGFFNALRFLLDFLLIFDKNSELCRVFGVFHWIGAPRSLK